MVAERADVSPSPSEVGEPGINRFIPSLYQVALAAVLGAIFIVALAPRLDTDMWWHLKVGQYIAVHHVVPSKDFMSFSFVGHPWTDHEWLAELAMYGLYRLAGLWGPIAAFAVLITATFAVVYRTMRLRQIHPVLALFVVAAAFVASSASWGPRIQMVTMFFVALYAMILYRFEVTRERRYLACLPALMLFWANIHGGFVLGLGILFLTVVGEWLNRITGREGAVSREDLRALALTFGVTVLVTMINPNTYRELLYPLAFVLPNAYTNLIQESASPNFHMPVMMVFELMLLLLVGGILVSRRRLNWTHLLLILAFTHLALSEVRNVPLWAVLISPLLAIYLQSSVPVLQQQFSWLSYRRRPVRSGVGAALNVVLLAMVALAYLAEGTRYVNGQAMRTAERTHFPRGAVSYMQRHRLPPRVFVAYEWGGYLLWRTFPRYRDYMDSRADTLFDDTILHGYLTIYSGSAGWQGLVRRYRIQDVLLSPQAPVVQILARDPHWRRVYHDPVSVLYVRTS